MKIAVVVGSLREDSLNKKLAKAMEARAPQGVEFSYVNIDLPLYNEELEATNYPAHAQEMKDIISAADGVLLLTPEYNRGLAGVMKNAIDWFSRPYGTNAFVGKPAGVAGVSSVATGSAFAQGDMRRIGAFLQMKIMGQPEVYVAATPEMFDENGQLTDERWAKNLTAYMEALTNWIANNK